MDIWVKFVLLAAAGYVLGSIPLSFLVARRRGVDLRKQGSQQTGGGNLWRTTSRFLGLLIGIYDFLKGALMIIFAWWAGLDAGLQFAVGLAVVVGHNWPLFLRFHGGRGIATTLGIIIILPVLNNRDITTWPLVAFFGILTAGVVLTRRTPVPIFIGLVLLPAVAAIVGEPLPLIMAYLALFLIIIIKRLTAQPNNERVQGSMGRVLLNRLFLDRDVRDRAAWVYRNAPKKEPGS